MARPLRYVPPRSLVEVTCRTVQSRFLLRPSRDLNDLVLGILARAAERYDVEICAFIFLSNHAHLLLRPANALELARFMGYLNGNLARDWPGASALEALLTGQTLKGLWFDRTEEFYARRRGESFGKYAFAQETSFELSPLPVWRHLAPEEVRRRIREIVRLIEIETRRRIRKTGCQPLGVRRILRQDPHAAPEHTSHSPAPRFHAHLPAVRKSLELACYAFRLAYRQAARQPRDGRPEVRFPAGCFPPHLPFVRGRPALTPV